MNRTSYYGCPRTQEEQYEQYIIDSIDFNDYAIDSGHTTNKYKLTRLHEIFKEEYGAIIFKEGIYKALCKWLPSLPPALQLEHTIYDIEKRAVKYGLFPKYGETKLKSMFLEEYWQYMVRRLLSLWTRKKII